MNKIQNIDIDKLIRILQEIRNQASHVDIMIDKEKNEIVLEPSSITRNKQADLVANLSIKVDKGKNLTDLI